MIDQWLRMSIFRVILLVHLLSSWLIIQTSGANCKTYSQRCLVNLGEPLVNPLSESTSEDSTLFYLETTIRDSIYAVLEHPGTGTSGGSLSISTSILYGSVDIFVEKNSEPSTSSSSFASSSGYLMIDLAAFTENDAINILIKSTTPSALKVAVSTPSFPMRVPMGYSFTGHTRSRQKYHYVNNVDDDHPFFITVIPLALAVPMIQANDPSSQSNSFSASSQGNVQLSVPSTGEYAISVTAIDDDDTVENDDARNGFPYIILISAKDDDSSPPSLTRLLSGQPFYHVSTPVSVEATYQNIIYETHYSADSRHISLVLESQTGNADLLVNTASSGFPGSANEASWVSNTDSFRDEVLVTALPVENPSPSSSKLYISVKCDGVCIYTLRAFEDLYISDLVEGSAISTDVLQGSYKYFIFHDSRPQEDMVFSLNRISGDPDLYIGCKFDPTGDSDGYPSKMTGHFVAKSNDYSTDILRIGSEEGEKRCENGDYYIAVNGFGWTSTSTRAAFTISAKHRLGVTTLIPGIPVHDTLDSQYRGKYRVHSGSHGGELTISVTLTYGDVDMYVKMNGEATEYDYDFRDFSSFWADNDDDWWTLDDDEGESVSRKNTKKERRLRLVSAKDEIDNGNDDNDDDNGSGFADTRRVVISANEICDDCWISVLLVPYEHTQLSIVAQMMDKPIQLQEGIPLRHVSSNTVQYFSFSPDTSSISSSSSSSVESIAVTKIVLTNMNQAQLVLSATASDADSTTVTDTSVGHVLEVLIKSNTMLSISVGAGNNASYTIRASTLGDSDSPPYMNTLLNALIQGDEIKPYDSSLGLPSTTWNYYQIVLNPGHERLTIRQSTYQGATDMFVTRCPSRSQYVCSTDFLPNVTSSINNRQTGRSSISIDRSDSGYGSYIVGVHSRFEGSVNKYTISYTLSHSALSLISDVPSFDYVSQGETDYYSYYHHSDSTSTGVKFLLTATLGFPSMFISTTRSRPSAETYTWSSDDFSTLTGSSAISITPDDANYCSDCTYYIAITTSVLDARYSITASTHSNNDASTILVGGQPYTDNIHTAFTSHYYIYHMSSNDDGDLLLNVVPNRGMVDIYVTLDGNEPSLLHHDYHSVATMFASDIRIKRTDSAYVNHCMEESSPCSVRIRIFAYMPSSSFTITISSTSDIRVLQMDVPSLTGAAVDEYKYFTTQLSTSNLDEYQVRLTTTISVGRVVMYVSCSNENPNDAEGQYDYNMDTGESQHLDIAGLSMKDRGCVTTSSSTSSTLTLYISIKGIEASVLSITVHPLTEPSAILLTPAHPIYSTLHQGNMDYYYVETNMDTYHDMHFHLIVRTGDVDLFVSGSWDTRPKVLGDGNVDPNSYLYSSSNAGVIPEDFTLKHNQVKDVCALHKSKSSSCYMVVAVLGKGGGGSTSSYTLAVTALDSTTAMTLGTPITAHVSQYENNYYRLVVVQYADLIVSLTPFFGDPDLFVSVAPIRHPNAQNRTWVAASWGADTLTIQAADLASHCPVVPNATTGDTCTIYLGISGFRNSSYTLVAHMDAGFSSAVRLMEGKPQAGYVEAHSYMYYKFWVDSFNEYYASTLIDSITIALTSQQGEGDQDLFVTFDGEPGHDHYDYHSSLSSSSVDEITIKASSPHYCTGCYVHIAVYGFTHGHFTITATSKGVTMLQTGRAITGHVDKGAYRYYRYRNNDPTAVLTFTMTAAFGDPDLFIDEHEGADKVVFPTINYGTFIWSSRRTYSNDMIVIKYDDPHFCFNCDYVLAVYGYRNASYTLSITTTEDEVIHLLHDHPQRLQVPYGGNIDFSGVKHCAYLISGQAESIVISLSSIDLGSADLYAKVLPLYTIPTNTSEQNSLLPNPRNSRSYDFSTVGKEDDVVHINGPFANESIVLITINAPAAVALSILVSTTESTITLQKGIPTNSFVAQKGMQYFKFYVEDSSASLQITLTSRSGDPDLMASMDFPRAICSSQNMLSCTNYTWRSASYNSDRILISPDEPCSADTTTMYVNRDTCNPATSYRPGFMYITVAGYTMSKFIITVSVVGEHITLLPGKPQLATTSQEFICSTRDEETGACDVEHSDINKRVNLAYFTVVIPPTAQSSTEIGKDRTSGNLMLALKPECTWNDTSTHVNQDGYILTDDDWYNGRMCKLGCDCDPLRVYVQSCVASRCTVRDRYPSEINDHYDASMTVASTGSSFFIQYDPFNPRNGYCDPNEHQENCVYYIAVTGSFNKEYTEKGTSFTITAAASDDVMLIPCQTDTSKTAADGVRLHAIDSITAGTDGKYYEFCNTNRNVQEKLIVYLEQCYGDSNLFACSEEGQACDMSVLPNEANWAYKTNGLETCSKSAHGDERCAPETAPSTSHQSLTVPLSYGNVYTWVAGAGAEYDIKMLTTRDGGHQQAILVQGRGGTHQGDKDPLIEADVKLRSVSVTWTPSLVVFPGMKQPAFTPNVNYKIMAVSMSNVHDRDGQHRYDTVCGAQHVLASHGPSTVKVYEVPSPPHETTKMTHSLPELKGGRIYRVMVYAECDYTCLKEITETAGMELDIRCSGDNGAECQPIQYMYAYTDVQTQEDTVIGEDDEDNTFIDDLITIAFSVSIVVVVVLFIFGAQYVRRKQHADATKYEITEMVDLDMWTSTHAAPSQVITQMKRQTALTSPVLDDGGLEESSGDPMASSSPLTRGLLNLSAPTHHSGVVYSPMMTSDDDSSSAV